MRKDGEPAEIDGRDVGWQCGEGGSGHRIWAETHVGELTSRARTGIAVAYGPLPRYARESTVLGLMIATSTSRLATWSIDPGASLPKRVNVQESDPCGLILTSACW